MDELLYFPTWMLVVIPQVINILKTWVPTLWREVLAAIIATVATAWVIVTTDLTLQPGIQEGFILFLLLTGTRAAVAGVRHSVVAVQAKVPLMTTRGAEIRAAQKLGMFLILGLGVWFLGGQALAQDSLRVAEPVKEQGSGIASILILLASQAASQILGWLFGKLKEKADKDE